MGYKGLTAKPSEEGANPDSASGASAARDGFMIGLGTDGDESLASISDELLTIPDCLPEFSPILASIPLQLLAYHVAVRLGCDVDQPRNLAKSVTVE